MSPAEPIGPAIALGPAGASFDEPVEVRLPAAGTGFDAERHALLLSAVYGEALRGGDLAGERSTRVYYDAETAELVAELRHFSVQQWVTSNLEWLAEGAVEGANLLQDMVVRQVVSPTAAMAGWLAAGATV